MRNILSKGASKSKERFNQLLIGLALVFLMFLSVLGYSLSGNMGNQEAEKKTYNGYEFVPTGSYWNLQIQGLEFYFSNAPDEVEDISASVKYIDNYVDVPLYLQSENSMASSEIYNNLNQIVLRMQNACLDEEDCEDNVPVKDCTSNFIIIEKANSSSLTQDNNCVFIRGTEEDLIKVTDEFLYKILGIKE